jgi:ubiquitin C-terminal hydrolase
MVVVFKHCFKCLKKAHSQVRVTIVKLIDYLFTKSHVMRLSISYKLLDEFDVFLELTLAITQRPKDKLKLPPPKKYADLLQEITSKAIHKWNADFGCGYEKLRYAYRFLKEH